MLRLLFLYKSSKSSRVTERISSTMSKIHWKAGNCISVAGAGLDGLFPHTSAWNFLLLLRRIKGRPFDMRCFCSFLCLKTPSTAKKLRGAICCLYRSLVCCATYSTSVVPGVSLEHMENKVAELQTSSSAHAMASW
uniref:Uncharacterized protein n=1 Tax=Pipistrellus kuhlii TaxID=59472 RepID=A0A7J7V659_PIPKU|nr:hypothetical protein mPipKuh1_008588 [Pipistrellus kuhlii]